MKAPSAPGAQVGAVGYLVGEPHYGLTYMFHMMNEARLVVGAAATALGYTGSPASQCFPCDGAFVRSRFGARGRARSGLE